MTGTDIITTPLGLYEMRRQRARWDHRYEAGDSHQRIRIDMNAPHCRNVFDTVRACTPRNTRLLR